MVPVLLNERLLNERVGLGLCRPCRLDAPGGIKRHEASFSPRAQRPAE